MTQVPSVTDGVLQGTAAGGAAGLAVGSPAWFAWLADDAARSFSFRSLSGTYTARKERDQAALFGLLARLRDLGATLLLAEQLTAGPRQPGTWRGRP